MESVPQTQEHLESQLILRFLKETQARMQYYIYCNALISKENTDLNNAMLQEINETVEDYSSVVKDKHILATYISDKGTSLKGTVCEIELVEGTGICIVINGEEVAVQQSIAIDNVVSFDSQQPLVYRY